MPQHQSLPPTRCEVAIRAADAIHVAISGEFDLALAPFVESVVRPAQAEVPLVVVDLERVVFIDSAALHLLLEADERARQAGTSFVVARPSHQVRRLLTLTATLDRLTIDDTSDLAVGA